MTSDALKQLDDDALARRAADGGRDALEVLLERHSRTAARMAYAILHRHDDALDAAQTALLKVSQELPRWSRSGFKGWLHACVHSAAVNLLRHNAMRRRHAETLHAQATQEHAMATAENTIARQEQLSLLREELAALPAETAAALALFHLQGLSVAEVAAETGLSADACKQRLSRGREQLRVTLERRGVALAGVAIVALIDTLCGSARAWAAELPPDTLQRLMQPALNHDMAGTSTADSETPAPSGTAIPQSDSRKRQLARALPAAGILTMMKSHPFAFGAGAAVLLGTLAGILLLAKPSVATRQPSMPATKTVADSGGRAENNATAANTATGTAGNSTDSAAAGAAARNVPTWQAPRFIPGDYKPLNISVSGNVVRVLAAQGTLFDPPNKVVVFESPDGGQSWSIARTLDGYMAGSAAVNSRSGEYSVLGLAPLVAHEGVLKVTPGQPGEAVNVLFRGSRADLLSFNAAGEVSAPQTIWQADENNVLFHGMSLICAGDAFWSFQFFNDAPKPGKTLSPGRMRIATGAKDSLRRVEGEWIVYNRDQPAAWAKDENTAGFAVIKDRQIKHFLTRDAGKTWAETAIPFNLDAGSEGRFVSVSPTSMTRAGDRLLLLMHGMFQAKNETDEMKMQFQRFTASSDDLGATWSSPSAASPRDARIAEGDGVHIMKDRWFMCEKSSASIDELMQLVQAGNFTNKTLAIVRMSDDEGKTWFNHHALDSLSEYAEGIVIGGNEDSLHVAIQRGQKDIGNKEPGCLIIRSYSAGAWKTPANPAPTWFKETKAPQAVQETF